MGNGVSECVPPSQLWSSRSAAPGYALATRGVTMHRDAWAGDTSMIAMPRATHHNYVSAYIAVQATIYRDVLVKSTQ